MSQRRSIIKRKAINSNGCLGSLYDACRDRLFVQQDRSSRRREQVKSHRTSKCVFINGNSDVSRNILEIIDVEDELRLSLQLEITQRIGIVAVLNDSIQINEHTRLLYYSWIDREEQISDEVLQNQLLKHGSTATHVITGIAFGIDIVIILNSLSEYDLNEIDRILQKISSSLSNGTDLISLITPEENDLLSRNVTITIHSNIQDLTGLKNVSKLLRQIDLIRKNSNQCAPVTYSLQPLTSFVSQNTERNMIYRPIPSELNHNLEQYVFYYRTMTTTLKLMMDEKMRKFLSVYLDGRLYGAKRQHKSIETKYYKQRDLLSELVVSFRSGQTERSVVNDALTNTEQSTFRPNGDELIQWLNDLKAKVHFIHCLRKDHIIYRNAIERDIDKHDNEQTVRTKLMMNDHFVRIVCSSDTLNRDNSVKLNKFLSDSIRERQENPRLQLVYADFSYCSYKLPNMLLMSSNDQSTVPVIRTSIHSSTKASSTDETINILLLGETGVGKSTFINALANYLSFDSLTQAKSGEATVIIPVSFLITIGKNFEEHIVKFGERNSSNNENFNDVGQSVTQRCKSYMFDLKRNGKKLRIIDTPGFGDTRGLQQDDQNMEHILKYISHLTHLNAICFLLKPNSSRLNMYFRTCLNQLFSFLAPPARKNVIFCFTNARSTFYTPGDTAPLLRTMLQSLSIKDIRFEKENTFCFDSESFRYLVALRNKTTFTEEDEREYQASWSTSVNESKRLIDYIQKNLRPYSMR